MLPEEARWLGQRIAQCPVDGLAPLVNVGSSTRHFTTRVQPWIDEHIFAPARARGLAVISVDIKAAEGIDLVGDVVDPVFRERVRDAGGRSLLCSNLLEHVADPAAIACALAQLVPSGGYLFVSGPRSYPWHADPFDTLFRPGVDELAALFPGTELVAGSVVSSGSYWDWLGRSPWRLLARLARLLVPFYNGRSWYSQVLKLGWMFRPFSATCVLLRKR